MGNNWETVMTNPKNKKNHSQFLEEVSHLNIEILGKYVNTDTKIEYKCAHGIQKKLPWMIIKSKFCCSKGYHEQRVPPLLKTLNERKQEIRDQYEDRFDITQAELDGAKIKKIRCVEHDVVFDTWVQSLRKGHISCPECKKLTHASNWPWWKSKGGYTSKSETLWLNTLNVPERQYWLSDVKYKVDGFDPNTNTVYLYHGRFWHGCPETYDPEEVHPIVKLKMGELYEKTLSWEKKIKEAGYKLIVKWGT